MATEIIYSVFVSSTFDDLREERGELQKALLKSKCFPIGMELFPSSDDDTWEFIKRQIDDADYYLVVIAGRYGSSGSEGLSYTEMEYDYARSINKPILAFIHGAPGKIVAEKFEQDPSARKQLEDFKTKVRRAIVNTYTSGPELAMQVMASLVELKDRKPAIGFVRSNQMIDAKKYVELLEENQNLMETVRQLRVTTEPFLGSDEDVSFSVKLWDSETHALIEFEFSFGEIFILAAEAIIDAKTSDFDIAAELIQVAANEQQIALSYIEFASENLVSQPTFTRIRRRLFALKLIELIPEPQNHQPFNRWKLTPYGQEQYALLQPLITY